MFNFNLLYLLSVEKLNCDRTMLIFRPPKRLSFLVSYQLFS